MSRNDSIFRAAIEGRPLPARIIDAHGHLGPYKNFPMPESDPGGLLSFMDRINTERMAISATEAACGVDYRWGNDRVIDAVRCHPGRFIGYCTLFPGEPEGGLHELLRCEKRGLRAIKIHSGHDVPYDAEAYCAAYRYADRKGYPLLAHTWGKPHLEVIDRLARSFKRIKWILGHSGSCDREWYVRTAKRRSNVFLEPCASMARHGVVEYFVREVGPERVLYGSDSPFYASTQQIGRVALARISEKDKRRILGLNAARIFGV